MLGYDKIDVSNGVGTNKADGWSEFIICYYWYFHHKF